MYWGTSKYNLTPGKKRGGGIFGSCVRKLWERGMGVLNHCNITHLGGEKIKRYNGWSQPCPKSTLFFLSRGFDFIRIPLLFVLFVIKALLTLTWVSICSFVLLVKKCACKILLEWFTHIFQWMQNCIYIIMCMYVCMYVFHEYYVKLIEK